MLCFIYHDELRQGWFWAEWNATEIGKKKALVFFAAIGIECFMVLFVLQLKNPGLAVEISNL
jgi:hypothetical protein